MNLINFTITVPSDLLTIAPLLTILLPKLVSASICGMIIGLEREVKHARSGFGSAGLKTITLICASACLFTATSLELASEYGTVDPSRIISYILSGVGFMGAGTIFKSSNKVIGITTAALIWASTAIGIVAGLGYVFSAPVLALGLIVNLKFLSWIESKFRLKARPKRKKSTPKKVVQRTID